MSVYQDKKSIWICQYRLPGQKSPVKEYFGIGEKGETDARVRDAEIKLLKVKGQEPRPSSKIYLDELAQHYINDLKARGKSERFRKELAGLLNKYFLPEFTDRAAEQITYPAIIGMVERVWGTRTTVTKARYIGYLAAIFRFGIDHELVQYNPLTRWKGIKSKKRDMFLSVEDLGRIMENAAPHLAWAIEVQWELGTRPGPSELFALKWSDVDWQAPSIHVRGTKTEMSDRIIPITQDFRARLLYMRQFTQTKYIIEYKGKPITKLRRSLATACNRAGITYNVRMYDIRHLFASVMLAGGGDLAAVSRLLGHSQISTTQEVYYHLQKDEMRRATALRPSIRKKKTGKVVKIG